MARTTVKRVKYVNGIPRANLEELVAIFEKDKRLPSVMSRRAWCKARKLEYGFINKWWWRRRSAAVKEGYNLVNEMYELPVGTPPEIVEEEEEIEVASEEEEICVVEPPALTTLAPLSRKRRIASPIPDELFALPSSPLVQGSDRSSSRTLQNSSSPIQGAYTPAQIARKTVSFAPGTKDLSPRSKLSDLVLPSLDEMDSCRGRHNPDITCDSCSLRSPSTDPQTSPAPSSQNSVVLAIHTSSAPVLPSQEVTATSLAPQVIAESQRNNSMPVSYNQVVPAFPNAAAQILYPNYNGVSFAGSDMARALYPFYLPPSQNMPMTSMFPMALQSNPSFVFQLPSLPYSTNPPPYTLMPQITGTGMLIDGSAFAQRGFSFPQVPLLQPTLEDSSRVYRADVDSSQSLYWNL
ncbi:hypothetical protein EDD18DRAFT_1392320 [Armillaria luteobubalina]|uniref:Uncharacterized protein n=1 Tax=Armillaria luteobubalina TaxID=153913 RepID=A0AA39Q585_9AGAR|nr:hypothetical protein EDD18DRAFT_1392320 [Armillaria luteobubalina]